MFEPVSDTVTVMQEQGAALEPGCLTGDDAVRLLKAFTQIARLAAAGKTKLARRVEQSNVWRDQGHNTPAKCIADKTGEPLSDALSTLETAEQLEAHPATAEAFNQGELSEAQTKQIASAATANPSAEQRLLRDGPRQSFANLRAQCRAAKAAAASADDDKARYRRIHDSRYWRKWTDPDGAVCGRHRLAPDQGAQMHAEIETMADQLFNQARNEGRRDPVVAYGADALIALVDAGANGEAPGDRTPRAMVHVRVDHEVLKRPPLGRRERGGGSPAASGVADRQSRASGQSIDLPEVTLTAGLPEASGPPATGFIRPRRPRCRAGGGSGPTRGESPGARRPTAH